MIIKGDSLNELKKLKDNSIDSIITDPPYELGFMGKSWDGTGIAHNIILWKECLRVLKPGGYLLSFSGTRTYHRMASAIEDAGFEVRDMIEWIYSTGFPKSLNIAKMLDKREGVEHPKNTPISDNGSMSGANYTRNKMDVQSDLAKQWEGWGTALKPAHEPICMARKPLAEKTVAENCLKWGTGGINIDESRVGTEERNNPQAGFIRRGRTDEEVFSSVDKNKPDEEVTVNGRFPANLIHDNSEEVRECFPETNPSKKRIVKNDETLNKQNTVFETSGYKERFEGGVDDNGGNASRFFKSIIYQAKASKSERNRGMEELETKDAGASMNSRCATCGKQKLDHETSRCKCEVHIPAEMKSRDGVKNNHPTVKPIALMEYLIKMVTPKNGIVLDPFAGSGSTLVAAKQNGYGYIGIEMESNYIDIINARLNN